ncbi:hypothetical protein GCM10009676_26810 [Prauserella halophila]|uniref:Uncharacterized protein n=1 Tax=Prauserella halophila TaxID=185641 RepID=A0ABP4GVV5_9PSEU|nr:hypothetical protein [Prauserella halophila]MCP2235057.1 hypothetical protein [Prauserella halophila]
MNGTRKRSGNVGTIAGPHARLQLTCGVAVALIGLYLAIGSDNPLWLSVAQIGAGATMAVPAWRSRPRHSGTDRGVATEPSDDAEGR